MRDLRVEGGERGGLGEARGGVCLAEARDREARVEDALCERCGLAREGFAFRVVCAC